MSVARTAKGIARNKSQNFGDDLVNARIGMQDGAGDWVLEQFGFADKPGVGACQIAVREGCADELSSSVDRRENER